MGEQSCWLQSLLSCWPGRQYCTFQSILWIYAEISLCLLCGASPLARTFQCSTEVDNNLAPETYTVFLTLDKTGGALLSAVWPATCSVEIRWYLGAIQCKCNEVLSQILSNSSVSTYFLLMVLIQCEGILLLPIDHRPPCTAGSVTHNLWFFKETHSSLNF